MKGALPTPDATAPGTLPENTLDEVQHVGLGVLALTFLTLGTTTFGGMWAAVERLEEVMVRRARWLKSEELKFLLLTASLIPAPKFIGLGALVGYKLRGWPGCVVATVCLASPSVLLVLSGVLFISPSLLDGPLQPLSRVVSIAVVGLLFGNAYQQLESARVKGRQLAVGLTLGLAVFLAITLGAPILVVALAGLGLGVLLMRESA